MKELNLTQGSVPKVLLQFAVHAGISWADNRTDAHACGSDG